MVYIVPTRGLLSFRYQFLTASRCLGIMNSLLHGYQKVAGNMGTRQTGSLVAWENGVTNNYGLKNAEERGVLFVGLGA